MGKYLVIGLGSMGKRRVRCLHALGIPYNEIYGIDRQEKRREEARQQYGISVVEKYEEVPFAGIEAVIVSLPPDKHLEGVKVAVEQRKPVFVEASVVLQDAKAIQQCSQGKIFVAPSTTFRFHPAIKILKEMVSSNQYGKVCNFSYHSGQYLPSWHPWESVQDFYVSKRETGGAREIVPYELSWIVDTFGFPNGIKGYFRKTRDLGCDIEDSYACTMEFGDMVGCLLVDVVGRNAARNLLVNFEEAQLQWRCDRDQLEVYEAETGKWRTVPLGEMIHEERYNKVINENMYIDEMNAFLHGIQDPMEYPNTMEKDIRVLELLEAVEDSDKL